MTTLKKKCRTAHQDLYAVRRDSLPYWKLEAIMKAELQKRGEPVTHIDPTTIDIADLIERASR